MRPRRDHPLDGGLVIRAVISASSFSITSGAFALKVTATSCSRRRREHDADGLSSYRTRGSIFQSPQVGSLLPSWRLFTAS